LRVDQYVSAKLPRVAGGGFGQPSADHKSKILPNASGPEQVPRTTPFHPVGPIEFTGLIHEQRPLESSFVDIRPLEKTGLKRDDYHRHAELVQIVLSLPQLRHMLTARQSPQMPVKHLQQPAATVILQPMYFSVGIPEFEADGR
jgi:hypothetical protein